MPQRARRKPETLIPPLYGRSVEMSEIEHLRCLFEEAAESYTQLEGEPEELRKEVLDRGHATTLAELLNTSIKRLFGWGPFRTVEEVEREAEAPCFKRTTHGTALMDALRLTLKSRNSALEDAEIWRLCYRLAFLLGYDIEEAREAVAKELGRRVTGGNRRWGARAWQKQLFRKWLPAICYDEQGRRRTQEAVAEAAREAIRNSRTPPVPDHDVNGTDQIQEWLKEWRGELDYKDWRQLPRHLKDWQDHH